MPAEGTPPDSLTFLESFMLSGGSTVLSKTISAPFEYAKLKNQLGPAVGNSPMVWTDVLHGNTMNCFRYFPTQAFNFWFKGKIRGMIPRPKPSAPYLHKLAVSIVSGGLAGAASMVVTYPLDVWRTQDVMGLPRSPWLDSYGGFALSAVGVFVYRGLYFGLYSTVIPLLPSNTSYVTKFIAVYGVTLLAGALSFPIDTVRRRMMLAPAQYGGAIVATTTIVDNEGVGALFHGCGWNIARGVVGAAVLMFGDSLKSTYLSKRSA